MPIKVKDPGRGKHRGANRKRTEKMIEPEHNTDITPNIEAPLTFPQSTKRLNSLELSEIEGYGDFKDDPILLYSRKENRIVRGLSCDAIIDKPTFEKHILSLELKANEEFEAEFGDDLSFDYVILRNTIRFE